jgi:Bacterial Ig-like domain (group 3)
VGEVRAITRFMTVSGLATLVALLSFALFAAGAEANPTGTPPSINPPEDSTTTSPQQGDLLTEVAAQWTGPLTSGPTIQWLDCDTTGANCAPVAANGNGNTYTVTAGDVGSTIEVQETASDAIGPTTLTSGPTVVVGKPPAKISSPSISGTDQQGQQLTVSQGTWTNNPTSISDQWMRCDNTGSNCANIHNATGQHYTLTSADVGNTIEVEETASNPGGTGSPADSNPTQIIAPAPHIVPTTTLLVVPGSSVTNQTSTLVATVTSDSAAVSPSGAVAFLVGGAPISGCSHVPVATQKQSVNVTCATAFSAATSPEQLTAQFTPGAGSGLAGSASDPLTLTVGKDSTTTSLDVSNPTLNVGSQATYTATVAAAHPGTFTPSGSVRFFDHNKPMTSCPNRTLVLANGFDSAQCTVRYRKAGTHVITAVYSGDAGFNPSFSVPQTVNVRPKPPQVLGTITTRMAWKFRFTPTFTSVLAMVARQARPGTKVTVICHGRHCPFAKRSMTVTKSTGCKGSKRRRCLSQKEKTVNLKPLFGGHRLPAGSHVTIELTHPHWIGKAYLFTIRAGRAPTNQIGCLAVGSTRLGVGC